MKSCLPMSATPALSAPLLTPKALCAQLSICLRTYSRLVRAGMPHVFVLTARRYDLAEVTAWLRTRTTALAKPGLHRRRAPMPSPQDDQLVRHLKLLARGQR